MTTVCDDPLAELAEMARRQQAEKDAIGALSAAKVRIVTGRAVKFDERNVHDKRKAMGVSAFFGSLVRRTQYVPDWTIPTACTNGKRTRYNPGFVAGMTTDQLVGLLCHEAEHDGFGHHSRFRGLDMERANFAADLSINDMLAEAGVALPKGGLRSGVPFEYRGQMVGPFPPMLSMEQYYNLLPDTPEGDGDGDGDGPGSWGEVEVPDNSSPATDQQAQQQAKQALAQAYQEAKQRGDLPAGMDKFVGDLLTAKVDWRNVVREFLTANAKVDVSWSRPSRKWLAQGQYLPSLSGQSLGHVCFVNDCSGSLDSMEWRTLFMSEAEGMMDACPPTKITIFHHDSVLQKTETWSPGDGRLPWNPKGGGGTSHEFLNSELAKLDDPVDLVICLTDLETCFGPNPPDCPVLFATTKDHPIPWGKKVLIDC